MLAPGWHIFGRNSNLQKPFDVAVVMQTLGRDSILEAVSSVYAQDNAISIQLLIGVDSPLGNFTRLSEFLETAPDHITPCLFYPGYSTSVRHGGLHPERCGGALRTLLSYLVNARYIAYLDDDNWWEPNHLGSLLNAIRGREWAFALRWFAHPLSRKPVCIDDWESVGPGRGDFREKFGGWVDPNCLMIDKLACEPALRWWSIPLPGDSIAMTGDRHVYDWLQKKSAPGETNLATVYYAMNIADSNHRTRLQHVGSRYASASITIDPEDLLRVQIIADCKPVDFKIQSGDDPLEWMMTAAQFESSGRLGDAESLYCALLKSFPDFSPAWHALGLLAFHAGKQELGVARVEQAVLLDSELGHYQRNLGEMYRRIGRAQEAIDRGRIACRLSPADVDAYYNLAVAFENVGQLNDAAASYRCALQLNPKHGLCWKNLGDSLQAMGDIEGARQAYSQALTLNPAPAEARKNS
ncbi:MAG: tetratricopeptide repeat protein [Burkholderiales bacterium]